MKDIRSLNPTLYYVFGFPESQYVEDFPEIENHSFNLFSEECGPMCAVEKEWLDGLFDGTKEEEKEKGEERKEGGEGEGRYAGFWDV